MKGSDIRHLLIAPTTVEQHSDKLPKYCTYHFVHEAVYGLPSDETAVDVHRFMHSVTYMASYQPQQKERVGKKVRETEGFYYIDGLSG